MSITKDRKPITCHYLFQCLEYTRMFLGEVVIPGPWLHLQSWSWYWNLQLAQTWEPLATYMHISFSLTPAPATNLGSSGVSKVFFSFPLLFYCSFSSSLFVFPLVFLLKVKSAASNVIYCKSNLSGSTTAQSLLHGLEGGFHCCCSWILPFLRESPGPLHGRTGCRQRRRGNLHFSPSTVTWYWRVLHHFQFCCLLHCISQWSSQSHQSWFGGQR